MPKVFVSVGSNIGRRKNIKGGLKSLRKLVTDLELSNVYETEAVGFKGSPFYNLVVAFNTDLSPRKINAVLKSIEKKFGRKRASKKFAPRTLDMDLLLYDDLSIDEPGLQIPRDEIFKYAFVLQPLAEMIPKIVFTGQTKTVQQLWGSFRKSNQVVGAKEIDWDPLK